MARTIIPVRQVAAVFVRRPIEGGHHKWIRHQYNIVSLNWGDGPTQTYAEPLCGSRAISFTNTAGAIVSILERAEVYNELRVYDNTPHPGLRIGYDLSNAATDAQVSRSAVGSGNLGIGGPGVSFRLDLPIRKTYAVFIRSMSEGQEKFIREPYNIVSLNWGDGSRVVDGVQVTGEQTYVEPTCGQHMSLSRLEREEVYDGLRIYDSPPFAKTRIGYGAPGQ